MRKIAIRALAFIILLVLLTYGIMVLFRSEFPYLWIVGLLVKILILIFFLTTIFLVTNLIFISNEKDDFSFLRYSLLSRL